MRHLVLALFLGLGAGVLPAWACPFCNVDGPATRAFIISVFGAALLGGFFILIWSIAAGHYHDVEAPKNRILELDDQTRVDLNLRRGSGAGEEKEDSEEQA